MAANTSLDARGKAPTASLESLPNEILHSIFVLSTNCNLLTVNHSIRKRLNDDALINRAAQKFFDIVATRSRARLDWTYVHIEAFLAQQSFDPQQHGLTTNKLLRLWLTGARTDHMHHFLHGPWTQARGDTLMAVLVNAGHRAGDINSEVLQKGFADAVRDCCIPAVLVLGGYEVERWRKWDANPVVTDSIVTWSQFQASSRPSGRNSIFSGETSPIDFCSDSTSTDWREARPVGPRKPWTRFTGNGFVLTAGFYAASSTTILFCMNNFYRDPILYEFVIRETVQEWYWDLLGPLSTSYTYVVVGKYMKSKDDMRAMTAWLLDPRNIDEGSVPVTASRMQSIYGHLLKKHVFPLEYSDIPYLHENDACKAMDLRWGPVSGGPEVR